jgi:hypothetical protein
MSKRHDPLADGCSPTSSKPQRLPKKQAELYRDVLTILENRKIPLAVSGTYALQLHTGICRHTKDLDIFLSTQDAAIALACLVQHGFRCEVRDPIWLAKAFRDKYFVDLITGMSNAAIIVDGSWIEQSRPIEILGIATRILAPEELLVSKLFVTRRERFDGADIAHVIYATKGELDWDRIVRHAGEHWEILLWSLLLFRYVYPGQSSYVPKGVWQDLVGRLRDALSNPDPDQKFRGSLIDDRMFAIDLQEWGLDNVLARNRAAREPIVIGTEAVCT